MPKDTYQPLVILSSSLAANVMSIFDDNAIPARMTSVKVGDEPASDEYVKISVAQDAFTEAIALLEEIIDTTRTTPHEKENRNGVILIPIDYTSKAMMGITVGFELARRLSAQPLILHSYVVPQPELSLNIIDAISNEDQRLINDRKQAEVERFEMNRLERRIESLQQEGKVLDVKYTTALQRGVPEEVILDYSRNIKPKLIVMTTRNSHKKAEELVGSVTAEVLDACRVPLFAVPEDYDFPGIRAITRIAFFCSLDKQDILSMQTFMSLFDNPEISITLIPVTGRYGPSTESRLADLTETFRECYPNSLFEYRIFPAANFREDFRNFADTTGLELLIVQNKKKNVFSRLINPGIAHILFYERDMPMIVLPT